MKYYWYLGFGDFFTIKVKIITQKNLRNSDLKVLFLSQKHRGKETVCYLILLVYGNNAIYIWMYTLIDNDRMDRFLSFYWIIVYFIDNNIFMLVVKKLRISNRVFIWFDVIYLTCNLLVILSIYFLLILQICQYFRFL